MGEHLDRRTVTREGWFQKKEKGMPDPDYRATCGSGFKGARWDAHHLIPQTSIEQSSGSFKGDKKRYINDVKYITKWVINNQGNMLGMPQFASFAFYYQAIEDKLDEDNPRMQAAGEQGKVQRYARTFNRAARAARREWFKNLSKQSPEGYPIHRPVSWGHTKYNVDVKSDLKSEIWDPLDEAKKKHTTDATTVAGQLTSMSNRLKRRLKSRGGGTTLRKWRKRNDKTDTTWFKPFTMVDLPKNPLFG